MFYSDDKKQYSVLNRRTFLLYLFKVSFFGIATHSSLKEEGLNAIEFASEFVIFLSKIQNELKSIHLVNKNTEGIKIIKEIKKKFKIKDKLNL